MSSYSIKPLKRDKKPLSGMRVLLTRAGEDNNSLAGQLRQLGAVALVFPCLQIENLAPPIIPPKQHIIFTSSNAVTTAANYWPENLRQAKYYAIGPATAAAMQTANFPTATVADPATSEGLLAHPSLQTVGGQDWLIIGGENPRTYLQDTLQERGADVTFIATYKRLCPTYESKSILRLNQEGLTHTVIQSMSALNHLAKILKPFPEHTLWQTNLIVPVDRYHEAATGMGFCGKVTVASCATDKAIIDALLQGADSQP